MGGILTDSRVTKRGESTSPFGYNDPCIMEKREEVGQAVLDEEGDNIGEFNFALDIDAARTVLSAVPDARLIPLESCTLVPASLRSNSDAGISSISVSSSVLTDTSSSYCNSGSELNIARDNLLRLLQEFGNIETQWDSITAAIYCNVFGTNCFTTCIDDDAKMKTGVCKQLNFSEMKISESGELSFPAGQLLDDLAPAPGEVRNIWMFPTFTVDDEKQFVRYLSSLLQS